MNALTQASLWAAATGVAAALYRHLHDRTASVPGGLPTAGDDAETGVAPTAAATGPGSTPSGDGRPEDSAGSALRRGRRPRLLIRRPRRGTLARIAGDHQTASGASGLIDRTPNAVAPGPPPGLRPESRRRLLGTLSRLVAALAVPAAGAGLWPGRSAPTRAFRTHRGQTVQLYGRGLYRNDTVFAAAGQRATDAVVLTTAVPLLLSATRLHRRGSLAGHLLLVGTLATFVYLYGSVALGTVVYNQLFLLYVALFSASLWAFALAFTTVDTQDLAARLAGAPRRGPATLMLASGAVTAGIWAAPLAAAVRRGSIPERLDSYSTPVTQALDLAVLAPSALFAGVRILRGDPLGYVVASSLLVLEVMLAPLIAAQTASQLAAGIRFPPGQVAGPIAGFVGLAVAAGRTLAGVLRSAAPMPTPAAA